MYIHTTISYTHLAAYFRYGHEFGMVRCGAVLPLLTDLTRGLAKNGGSEQGCGCAWMLLTYRLRGSDAGSRCGAVEVLM